MGSSAYFLDLTGWASLLGPVFRQALDPATPVSAQRNLAEQASECLEEGALLGDRAADGELPWRALMAGDDGFLALEDGFALARFDASNLISLRLETFDGRRWSVLHTGRGLAAFRQAAMGRGSGTAPTMKIESHDDQGLVFSRVFHPDGRETDAGDRQSLPDSSPGKAGPGLAQPVDFGPALLGAGAILMRRALENLKAKQDVPEPSVAPPAADTPAPPEPEIPDPALSSPPPPADPLPSGPGAQSETPSVVPTACWHLVGITGPLAGQSLPVTALSILGRDPAADIRIDNVTISRRHAELRPTDQGMVLKDLGSANGSWIAGRQLQEPALLQSGEKFILGECAFLIKRT
jgi:hypothetical protein